MDTRELNGKYIGKVIDGGLAKAGTGSEQAALLCELGGDGPEKGTKLTFYGYFSEKTVDSTIEALRNAGWQGTDLEEVNRWKEVVPNPPDVEFVIRQKPVLDPETGEETAETRPEVRFINRVAGLGVKERLSPQEAQSFAQKMKGRLLAFDKLSGAPKNNGAAAPRQSPPKAAAPGPAKAKGDLDIPF